MIDENNARSTNITQLPASIRFQLTLDCRTWSAKCAVVAKAEHGLRYHNPAINAYSGLFERNTKKNMDQIDSVRIKRTQNFVVSVK